MAEQNKVNLADPKIRKRFVTYKEAAELYSIGLTKVQDHEKIKKYASDHHQTISQVVLDGLDLLYSKEESQAQ